jgi:uncharacterized membrane protein YkvA (DUF1232 family)
MARIASMVKSRFLRFRREILVVAFALRHPETPWRLRAAGVLLMAYLASPVDLVPVFIPFLGVVDDLLLVPWGLSQVVGRLPSSARDHAEVRTDRFLQGWVKRPLVFLGVLLAVLAVLWIVLLRLFWWWLTGS